MAALDLERRLPMERGWRAIALAALLPQLVIEYVTLRRERHLAPALELWARLARTYGPAPRELERHEVLLLRRRRKGVYWARLAQAAAERRLMASAIAHLFSARVGPALRTWLARAQSDDDPDRDRDADR
eukprot:6939562-Prymnesium_polylepis.1